MLKSLLCTNSLLRRKNLERKGLEHWLTATGPALDADESLLEQEASIATGFPCPLELGAQPHTQISTNENKLQELLDTGCDHFTSINL